MRDFDKTKSQLISELEELRKRNADVDAQKLYHCIEGQTSPESPVLANTLFQEIPAAIIVHGSHGEILSCNKKAQEMLGVTKDEMAGKNVVDPGWKYLKDDGSALPSENYPVNQVLASKKPVEDFTIGLRRPDQSDIQWVYVNANPVFVKAGEVSQVIVTFVDITGRKKAEEAFRRTRFSVDQSIDSIYWLDAEGNILDVNDAATLNLGYTKEEFLSMKVHDLGDEFPPEVWKSQWEMRKEQKHLLFEATQIRKNGSTVPVEINSNFVVFDGEELICSFVRDITDRKLTAGALRESENTLRSIFKVAPTGIGLISNRIIRQVNDKFCEMVGYSREELLGKNARMVYPSDEEYKYVGTEKYYQIKKFGTGTVETRMKCKDGKIIEVILSSTPLTPGDLSSGVTFTALDITERKQAEEALRESEKKFRTLFETSRDALGFASPEGTIIDINQSWLDLFGYRYNEVINSDVRIIYVNPDDRKLFSKKLEKNGYVKDYEIKLLTKGNREIDCLVTANVCRDAEGNILYYQTITRDITEHKQLEEQLQIRERMDSLATLVGGIAHDFNNLLMGIMGNIDLLRMDADILNNDQADYVEEAFQSCRRAAKLIKKLQTLSKSKGSISKATSVDIYHVAKDVFSILERTTDKLIGKKIDFGPGKYFVTGDFDQLHQVLLNLGTNSVHAIEKKGVTSNDCITITAKKHEIINRDRTGLPGGLYIHIFFKDTGTGMSERVKRRAFDPLFTTKDRGQQKGQGLGLAMAYNIITRYHNGAIDIETSTGKGTTLHVYLPVAEKKAVPESRKIEDVPGGNETILIVEDEVTISKMVEEALKKYGYSILTAFDGKEGLDVYNDNRDTIDLVLLDLTMPTMSGKMFLERILEINPDVKVVISSGHSEEVLQKHTKAKGYVTKPYMLKDLAQIVRTVLDS